MKKYIKLFINGLLILILISACQEDFLEEEVLDAYAPVTLTNQLGFEASAIGLYNKFSTWLTTTDDQGIHGMFQLGTDVCWNPMGRCNGNARPYHDYATLTASDDAARKFWEYLYSLVNNANVMIANAEGELPSDMTQDEVDSYNAEGKFFRAYAYNELATFYGGVPLLTEPLTEARTDFVRASLSEINSIIISDLLFSIEYLPSIDEADEARANQSMARQLLAEVYLRTGVPASAESQLDEIINSGSFSLITERYGSTTTAGDAFSDMFRVGKQRRGEGNTEAIWILEQENPSDVSGGSTGWPQQRRVWGAAYHDIPGMEPCDSLGGRGLTRLRLNNWVLYDLYEEGDMRNSEFSIHRQHYFNNTDENYDPIRGLPVPYGENAIFTLSDGSTIEINELDSVYKLAPYTLKWGQFDSRDVFGYGMWKDYVLMRLGETYLLRAEARFKQGDLQGAADDINVLRNRAQASNVSSSDVTLDLILDERVRELIGEENRRKTLVRTGTLIERTKRLNGTGSLADGNIEATIDIQSHNVLLPIPQTEIDLNKDAVLEQNSGY